MFDPEWDLPEEKPYWQCQECGFKDENKPLPKDRNKFYKNPKPAKCRKCGSEASMPTGW